MTILSKEVTSPNKRNNLCEDIRHNWTQEEAEQLFSCPFNDLLFEAQTIHRRYFNPNEVQISTLLSIKTGGCPEDCSYCPQSAHYDAGKNREPLMGIDSVLTAAMEAKNNGASRFCMGAAWRNPKNADLNAVCQMIQGINALGMETCVTLGMLTKKQAERLHAAGLDYYNHNIDTSETFYKEIITTRTFNDRIQTLKFVRDAGINVCSGGIVGMGETETDRAAMLVTLATLPEHPKSVPINMLIKVKGTPLAETDEIHTIDFIRTIAAARIMMPTSVVRLSAGRINLTDEAQALCFAAGANSIFFGDVLLTTENPHRNADQSLFKRLGITPMISQLDNGDK